VSIREELILKVLAKESSVVDLAEEYGVARKTIYKWLKRYEKRGLTGLVDESRRPNNSPMKTSAEFALEIVQLKKEHMRWGPKKISTVLAKRHPEKDTPSIVTIQRVLRGVGLMKRSRRRASGGLAFTPTFLVPTAPNDLWTVDFKGWWRTKDGAKCEPLTVRDAFSRFVISVRLMTRTRSDDVRPVFEELFARYGLPKAIQSDNGPPFATMHGLGGLTRLSAWWVSIGIRVVRSRPGHPTDNGGHERMHNDMRFDLEDASADTLGLQQRACDDWVTTFNHVRPHEGIGQQMPGELYRASERRPGRVVIGGYPDGCRLVDVGHSGSINCDGWKVYLSHALSHYAVGLQAFERGYRVWFFHVLLGTFVPGTHETLQPAVVDET